MRKFIGITLFILPVVAYADLVWPALFLGTRLFSWWAITVGLVIEYLFVRRLFGLNPMLALEATVSANVFSSLAGAILIPIAGIVWELFPGSLYMWAFEWGTFNPLTWAGAFLLACLINALLEGALYNYIFKVELQYKSKKFGWLVLANAFSVGVALASIWVVPVQ